MNVLFLTLAKINIHNNGIYSDLMRCFASHGHSLYIVSPIERKYNQRTILTSDENVHYLQVRTLNIQKTNIVEKGIATLLLENQFCNAISHYFKNVHFDLLVYSTPPITFAKVIKYVKKHNPLATSYLLLKDIFPQNAVDLGMFSNKSLIYQYFRRKEVDLYRLSDYIGCMSPKNVEYILQHNPNIDKQHVEIAPNSVEVVPLKELSHQEKEDILTKYAIPKDKIIFIYGGNLGKPQGIPFLIQCLDTNKYRNDCHFVIVGNGTEYNILQNWYHANKPNNVSLLKVLPKEEYDQLVKAADVGLIFLDYRFTIPNFPSRLLPYMQYKMPIIAATDPNTDVGSIIQENQLGYTCPSNDSLAFSKCVDEMLLANRAQMGQNAYSYLCAHYTVEHTYNAIVKHIEHV